MVNKSHLHVFVLIIVLQRTDFKENASSAVISRQNNAIVIMEKWFKNE